MIPAEKNNSIKEKHFQTLVEKTTEGLVLINERFEIIYANPAVEAMSGFKIDRLRTLKDVDFIHPEELDELGLIVLRSFAEPGASISYQMRVLHSLGHYFWIEGIITNLLQDEDVKAFALNFRDVSERKDAERIINELNHGLEDKINARTSQLEASNRELEAFTYSVSHDLRAPLRAINGYAKLLEEEYSNVLDSDGNTFVGIIRKNASNMGQLIDELLSFSKLGRKKAEISLIDMNKLVREVEHEISLAIPHHAQIIIHPLPVVYSDSLLLHQVIFNLISNAIKYSSKREKPVVEISAIEENGECIFIIKDNGAGFDMRHVTKLFGVFNRLHSQEEFEGVGVGLAIVQRIIEKFEGRVWAEGKVNEGATFYFTIKKQTNE